MNKLMELRLTRGKTRTEIAKALGITPQAYANYERNDRNPNIEMLRKIATLFGVTVDDVVDGLQKPTEVKSPEYAPALLAFLDNFAKLPEQRRVQYAKRVLEDLEFLNLK